MQKKLFYLLSALVFVVFGVQAQTSGKAKPLSELQQQFVDLRFGMFIHFGIGTYTNADWPDPEAPGTIFNPTKLDCKQWAKAAKSANMSYGCLTTKHHNGFCLWDTKTTDYSVMNGPLKRDVVKEYVEAFRAEGLKVMLYYSILDIHHELRPNAIKPKHIEMVKHQITELLTKYGTIEALIIDGWDAPWSRISYDDIPFEEVYKLVKKLQPNCLIMDLNGAKYPAEGLYYTDIKTYEMGAGQYVSKETNQMPALACLPLNSSWFWKTDFPTVPVRNVNQLVNENLISLNNASCNFILNAAPNREGLFDDNTIEALKEIGRLWKNQGPVAKLNETGPPLIAHNLAKFGLANSSWSDDSAIMDYGNDDNFRSAWQSNAMAKEFWYAVDLKGNQQFNAVVIFEAKPNIRKYKLEYHDANGWKTIFEGENYKRLKMHRFKTLKGDQVKITIQTSDTPPSVNEFQVYHEPK